MRFLILILLLFVSCGRGDNNMAIEEYEKEDIIIESEKMDFINLIPQGKIANMVYIVTPPELIDDFLFIQALQGITAREEAAIYINAGRSYALWLEMAQDLLGFETKRIHDVWDLVDIFGDILNGYIIYDMDSLNIAATLSGLESALPITNRMIARAEARGLELLLDAREYNSAMILEQYGEQINKRVFLNQQQNNPALRDIGIMLKAIVDYERDIASLLEFFEPNTLLLGWHHDEVSGVQTASKNQAITIPSDHAYNLSFLASMPRVEHEQKQTIDIDIKAEQGKHYVAFVYSDGDNIQWMTGGAPLDTDRFAHSSIQDNIIPFGWSLSPGLSMWASVIMDYLYKNMSTADEFVSAVSGFGYIHPSEYFNTDRLEDLEEFAALTSFYMNMSDMRLMEILDEHASNPRTEVLDIFTAHDNINGIFYKTGDRYVGGRGFIRWSNDKPVVAFRESLWTKDMSRKEREIYEMAYRVTQYPKDPTTINGFTLINVHAWSHEFESIRKMVAWWDENDPNIIVVTPTTFMRLISENLPRVDERPNINFDSWFDYPDI